jgi:CheY-like chemotaxis protein
MNTAYWKSSRTLERLSQTMQKSNAAYLESYCQPTILGKSFPSLKPVHSFRFKRKVSEVEGNSMNALEVAMTTKLVLLVDNEANVREIVQACLQDLGGWDVQLAASAQEGLDTAVAVQPDAIVLDISMLEIDGLTFLQKLRANPVTQLIPVVLLTAKARWFTPHQLQSFGVAGAIAKPFNPISLSNEIANALGW